MPWYDFNKYTCLKTLIYHHNMQPIISVVVFKQSWMYLGHVKKIIFYTKVYIGRKIQLLEKCKFHWLSVRIHAPDFIFNMSIICQSMYCYTTISG